MIQLPKEIIYSKNKKLMSCDTVYLALDKISKEYPEENEYKLSKSKIMKLLNITRPTLDTRLKTLEKAGFIFLSSYGTYTINKREKSIKLSYKKEVSKIFNTKTKYTACIYGYLKKKKEKRFTQVGLAKELNIDFKTIKLAIDEMVKEELINVTPVELNNKTTEYIFSLVNTVSKEERVNKILRDIEEWKMELTGEDLKNVAIALELLNKIKKGN